MTHRPTLDRSIVDRQHVHAERTGRAVGAGAFSPASCGARCPTRCASSTRAPSCATRSCSWSGSARSLVTVLADRRPERVRLADRGLAVVHRPVRQPRRGRRRGPRQGPGRQPAPDPHRDRRPAAARTTATEERVPGTDAAVGDRVVVEAGQVIPGDGDIVEGIATVDESAITGESAPVIRESGGDRSLGHRRHHRAVRPDRRADHREARRVVRRPDDRPGRGRAAAEDARTRSR